MGIEVASSPNNGELFRLILSSSLLFANLLFDIASRFNVIVHLLDAAIVQFHAHISYAGNTTIMGDDNHGSPLFGETLEQLNDTFTVARIQIASWLIGQNY